MATTYLAEPEEMIEAQLVTLLAEHATLPVEGVMTPATAGTVKQLSRDSVITVSVDQSSNDLDRLLATTPRTYESRVTVHVAQADDPNGEVFRDECRRVAHVLNSLIGDGCASISTSSVRCDGYLPSTTSTSFEAGDNPTISKTYAATIKACVDLTTPSTTDAADAAE